MPKTKRRPVAGRDASGLSAQDKRGLTPASNKAKPASDLPTVSQSDQQPLTFAEQYARGIISAPPTDGMPANAYAFCLCHMGIIDKGEPVYIRDDRTVCAKCAPLYELRRPAHEGGTTSKARRPRK